MITIDVERLYQDAEKGVYEFLPILDEYSVKATFFLTCDVLTNCPDIAKDVLSCGHEVACHGFHHPGYSDNYTLPYLAELPEDEIDRELIDLALRLGLPVYVHYQGVGVRFNWETDF